MPCSRHRLACCLGAAVLALSLPACSAPTHLSSVPSIITQGTAWNPGDPMLAEPSVPAALRQTSAAHANEDGRAGGDSPVQESHDDMPDWFSVAPDPWERLREDVSLTCEDYRHYYSWPNLGLLGLGIGAAAPLANTSADSSFQRWYQRQARHGAVDSVADVVNYIGQLWVVAPVALEVAGLAGRAPEDYRTDGGLYEWSNRSLRAIATGFPPVVALYGILGASRPDRDASRWRPFNDHHGISGHTFMGAVPFLTAAAMTDNPWLKYPLVAGSMLTGWARVHMNRHYLSQVALGWWMAYLAVRSVGDTQAERGVTVVPTFHAGGPGVGLEVRY